MKLLFVFLLFTLLIWTCSSEEQQPFSLLILHTNDVHSQFLETNRESSASCTVEDKANGHCYGGFSRLHYKVEEIRMSNTNVVYLSGGDYFQGTVWYTLYKWKYISEFVNKLGHTAMALGNHEFDDKIDGLLPFLENATFPIISCNIDASSEPRLIGKVPKSVTVEVGGRKVGIIGYTIKETNELSYPEKLKFLDEVESITQEANRLHEEGVKIIIALGHAGYDVDLRVAKIPFVDVVVGGHTNTFLYTGTPLPDVEKPEGLYPTVVTTNGRSVPVVQAYAFGKYLGFLNVTFNDEGETSGWSGNPILLNSSIPQDMEMEGQLEEVWKELQIKTKIIVGNTNVYLDGNAAICRRQECNMGNLFTDAMVLNSLRPADDVRWTNVSMAIVNAGTLRASIDEKSGKGTITMEHLMTVFPFQDTVDVVEIRGKHLREVFEFAIQGFDPKGFSRPGKFLQVSGIQVIYDVRRPDGNRVVSLNVLCTKCRVPTYEPLDDNAIYSVATTTYMTRGGDGHAIFLKNIINHHISGNLALDVLLKYIEQKSPILQSVEGRIKILTDESDLLCNSSACVSMTVRILLPLSLFTITVSHILA